MTNKLTLTVFLLFLGLSLQAQKTIQGIVSDQESNPIPGANITVKGTSYGTVTDLEGHYSLPNISSDDILIFSFIGMLSQEIPVGDQTHLNVSLQEDIMNLEQVVVIGYGAVKRKDLTGSVTTVESEEITKLPTSNPLEAIQGKVPGLDIARNSGSAGSGVYLRVRGNRSIGDPNDPDTYDDQNEPLFIIDGVQGGSYSDINPNDIESINVLKDASATAIYGSQGANGVIIITTKKGKPGKSKISYNGYFGINGLTEYPKVRLGEDYIEFRKEAYRSNGDWDDAINNEDDYNILFNAPELAAIDSGQWVDWQDLLIKNGIQQSHQISYSTGNEKTTSYFSANYFGEEGTLKMDNISRYSARLNIDHHAAKWISIGLQSQVTYIDQNRRKDPLATANSITPLGKPYDDEGNIIVYPVAGNSDQVSPLTDERKNIAKDNTIRLNALVNGFLELKPFNGMTFRSNLGTNVRFDRRGRFNDATSLSQKNTLINAASIEASDKRFLNWDNILTYSKLLTDHSFSITALTSYIQSISDKSYAYGINQANAQSLFYNLQATDAEGRVVESYYTKTNAMSYAVRVNYSYKDRYILAATERVDGASVLTAENRWDHFPSVSAAWILSEENFMKSIRSVSNLKIRSSYGIAGNSGISAYGTQSGIQPFPIGFGEVANTAYKFNSLIGNTTLGWEKSKTTDIGLDLGIMQNRFNATVDVYKTETDDILLERALPRMTGVSSVYQNIGSTRNRGIEVLLNTLNIRNNNFSWSSTFTFSKNIEEITHLVNDQDIINNEENSLVIGYPIKTFYTYNKLGIWQLGEEEEMSKYDYSISPGDIKLENLDNDSIIGPDDRKVIGSAVPDWVAGFENTFRYKSLELSIYLFARWGQMIDAEFLGRYNPSGEGNGPAYLDYWTPDNPTNDFPRPLRGSVLSNYFGYQTLTYVDGSYFKIKNIKLAYSLPQKIIQKAHIEKMQIYITASNILTVSKSHLIKYYDPERGGSESAPLSKQIVFGINIDI